MLPSNNNIDPSNPNELLREKGFPGNPPPKVGEMPAGNSQFVVPHFDTFQGIYNLAQRSYYWTFDDALKDSRVNARVMRRDPVLMQALRARQMPTCQLSWHLLPQDETDPEQQDAAALVTKIINNIPRFQELTMGLLEALWYGRYGIQLVYRWEYEHGVKMMKVVDHRKINGDKLCFKYSGDAGILVNGMYDGEKTFDNLGMVHWFSPMERESVIIHKFESEDADYQLPEMAGSINGVGIRGRLYWLWFQKQNVLAMLMDYLQRCALGYTIYYFDAGNPNGLAEAQIYASRQAGSQAIFWPRYRSDPSGGYGIQRIEPGNSGAQLLQELVTRYFDDIMVRYILGQNLSSRSEATGIGSGLSDLHGTTLARIIKYDAVSLQETLTEDLVKVLYKYNCPNVPPSKLRYDVDMANAQDVINFAEILFNMGLPLNANELYTVSGLAPPSKSASVLSKIGSMSPVATSATTPTDIPSMGTGPQNT